MVGEDAKKIKAELEAEHARKPGFFSRAQKFLKDYAGDPKELRGFELSYIPLPNSVKDKIFKKFGLPDYRGKLYNRKLVKRYTDRHDYVRAYEAFWSTWNPPAQKEMKNVYRAAGGDKHPVRASAAAWAYSSFMHTAVAALPIYAIGALTGNIAAVPYTLGGVAAFFGIAGAPVVYSKWRHNVKANKQKPN